MANQLLTEARHALGSTGRTTHQPLTLPDIIVKAGAGLGVLIAGAGLGWVFLRGSFLLYLAAIVAVMIFGVFLARRAPITAPLAVGYLALLGTVIGAFSYAATASGGNISLIPQAIGGTIAGAVGMLAVYQTPFGRKASKAVKFFVGAILAYLLISLASFVGALLGVGGGWGFYGVGAAGIALCIVGVALACWSLLIDIGSVDDAVRYGAPHTWAWTFAVAIVSSLAFLYLELLRLLAITNR